MKLNGEATLHAPPDKVWDALNDPAVLVRTIPGARQISLPNVSHFAMLQRPGEFNRAMIEFLDAR